MKPHRMRMTNELIIEYGLVDHLDVYVSAHPPFLHFSASPSM